VGDLCEYVCVCGCGMFVCVNVCVCLYGVFAWCVSICSWFVSVGVRLILFV